MWPYLDWGSAGGTEKSDGRHPSRHNIEHLFRQPQGCPPHDLQQAAPKLEGGTLVVFELVEVWRYISILQSQPCSRPQLVPCSPPGGTGDLTSHVHLEPGLMYTRSLASCTPGAWLHVHDCKQMAPGKEGPRRHCVSSRQERAQRYSAGSCQGGSSTARGLVPIQRGEFQYSNFPQQRGASTVQCLLPRTRGLNVRCRARVKRGMDGSPQHSKGPNCTVSPPDNEGS
jgi:hypothetical protein